MSALTCMLLLPSDATQIVFDWVNESRSGKASESHLAPFVERAV
ncbi:hypothetical protein [Streptomyces orinoci]|uniref:Uncharacterized protein n=1 Tax=Streptomyces orinoci TaxID=67339 RepID=A0ABV3K293_STRON|nr:hypothetical protein [Streptomyces orinoci]